MCVAHSLLYPSIKRLENTMIKVENLSFSFPEKDLYHKISFTLEDNQHCAFIGTSGSGKSTLLDMIMDPEKYLYDGKINSSSDCTIGYVSQFATLDNANELTVFKYIGEKFIQLQEELASLCTQMETSTDFDSLLEKYQQILDSYQAIGGDDFESNIHRKLNLANLGNQEQQLVSKLSSGEFKLIQVIKEMLTAPDILLMDEPDVFLDFENLNSLMNLINSYQGILLVVTHNRYLLNHCFNKILHLENNELQEFDGTYIDYNVSLLQRKIELQELAAADTEELERNEMIIENLRNAASNHPEASRGKSLKARIKFRDRLEARRIKEPFVTIKQPEICFAYFDVEETVALKVKDYSVAFEDTLLEHIDFEIKSTDKVAIVGSNGTGKTTLLRDIFHHNHTSIDLNKTFKTAFLSQQPGEVLNESHTVKEELFDAGFQTLKEIQSHLSKFGLEEEFMCRKIGSLSGGEKNMLQLAKISTMKVNLLLLDEPTSHLDTYSQIALEKALNEYKGAVLMVSHDFYSIVNCMDYILLIEDKTIRKMSIRSFRKMIYANHFDKEYLEIEQKKKAVETKIELALKDNDFTRAKVLFEEMEGNYT